MIRYRWPERFRGRRGGCTSPTRERGREGKTLARAPGRYAVLETALILVAALATAGCGGTYTYPVTGTVRSAADGLPIPAADLRLEPAAGGSGPTRDAQSDANGNFALELPLADADLNGDKLPAYTLRASKPGFVGQTVNIAIKQRPSGIGKQVPITFAVTLPPAPATH